MSRARRASVAVTIAERRDPAVKEPAGGGGVKIAVRRDGDVAHRSHVGGDHRRAESSGSVRPPLSRPQGGAATGRNNASAASGMSARAAGR